MISFNRSSSILARGLALALAALAALTTRAAAAADFADVIVSGGRIYTVAPAPAWASAVAIRGRQFVYVGDAAGVKRYQGPATRVIDLGGRMAMPGLHDAHAHLLVSGEQNTIECRLPPHNSAPLPDVIAALQSCGRKLPDGAWIVGGRVSHLQFPGQAQHRAPLDAAFPDRPVFLDDFSLHHALVNSKALAIAGIDRNTPDPAGGRIVKDAAGEPTGVLLENATWLVRRHIPVSPERDREAVRWAVREYNRYGFTSVQEASANRRMLTALRALDDAGQLSLNVAAHLVLANQSFGQGTDQELQRLVEQRNTFRTPRIHSDFVKLFVDGVPAPPWFTSASMDRDNGRIETEKLFIQPEKLQALLTRCEAEGLKAKLHVSGDGASHVAIDAMVAARHGNPGSPLRHDLAHATLITPADMERMGQAGIVAEVSPILWPIIDKVGNPPKRAWEFRSLQNHGVLITMGTDAAVTPNPSLFVGLQGMLQRGDESIDLPAGIRTMTINGAVSLGWAKQQGSIEPGKTANLIVLDRNLFEVPTQDIAATEVLLTLFEGRVVYSSQPGLSAGGTAAK